MSGQRKRADGSAAATEPTRQFVSNLTRLMAVKGMTPTEVAARADIHRSHLSLILSGERVVQLDTVVKLAGALAVAPEQLLAGVRWLSDGQGGGEFQC